MPLVTFGLPTGQSKSTYSLAFLAAIAAQAGAAVKPTGQDQDVHAIDATVDLLTGPVDVQLKCTESPRTNASGIRIDLKRSWIEKWRLRHLPVYVVGVVVPTCQDLWIEHPDEATHHRTIAYWQRFDPLDDALSIVLPYTNRLTAETLTQWRQDLDECFGGGGHG